MTNGLLSTRGKDAKTKRHLYFIWAFFVFLVFLLLGIFNLMQNDVALADDTPNTLQRKPYSANNSFWAFNKTSQITIRGYNGVTVEERAAPAGNEARNLGSRIYRARLPQKNNSNARFTVAYYNAVTYRGRPPSVCPKRPLTLTSGALSAIPKLSKISRTAFSTFFLLSASSPFLNPYKSPNFIA